MEVRLSTHGVYQHQNHVLWIPKHHRRILRGAIKFFVQEYLPQIQHYHPDVDVQQWNGQIDHIHVVIGMPPKYAVSSMIGKRKANLSRKFCLRYSELKRTLQAVEIAEIWAFVVHALSEEAKRFYEQFGFQPSPTDPTDLMITLKDSQ